MRKELLVLYFLNLSLLFSACSTTPQPKRTVAVPNDINSLLVDELFVSGNTITEIQEVDIFALPPDIQSFLDREVMALPTEERRYRAIREWVFGEAKRLEYDPDVTVSIDQLESAGKINCFSFSNLFIAAARYADIEADIQLVYSPPNWDSYDNTWVLNQHINVSGVVKGSITLGESRAKVGLPTHTGTIIKPDFLLDTFIKYVVDLNPKIVVNAYRTEILEDHEITARFYGNKSAQALLNDEYTEAYLYTKKALSFDKASSLLWNNLGVLYSRIDEPDLARQSYLMAIQVDPDADSARNNLASLYRRIGNTKEAKSLDSQISERREKNPYYHFYLGEDLLDIGDYQEAIKYFRAAIRRKKDEQQFYLSMAEAQLGLEEFRAAEKSLTKAERYAEKANTERLVLLTQQLQEARRVSDL